MSDYYKQKEIIYVYNRTDLYIDKGISKYFFMKYIEKYVSIKNSAYLNNRYIWLLGKWQ